MDKKLSQLLLLLTADEIEGILKDLVYLPYPPTDATNKLMTKLEQLRKENT